MSTQSRYANLDKKIFYALGLLATLQLLVTLLTFDHALTFDESVWHYIGRNWFRHGLVPYRGGIDNKSPLIFLIYGLSDSLFGVNYWFPRVIGTLCQTAGIFFIYRIAAQQGGRRTGILAMTLYGLSLCWYGTGGKFVSLTETYAVTATIISVFYFQKAGTNRNFLISGLAAAVAVAFRLTALAGAIAVLIFSFRSGWKALLFFVLGFLVFGAILLAGLSMTGIAVSEFWAYAYADNFLQHSITDHLFEWKLDNFINGFFHSELILFYPFFIGYFLIARRVDWMLVWFFLGCCCICRIGMYSPQHFKDILPPLALTSALCIDRLLLTANLPFKKCLAVLGICFFPKLAEPVAFIRRLWYPTPDEPTAYCHAPWSPLDNFSRKRLGWWIRDQTAVDEKVLVAGLGAQILVYTERVAPSVYINAPETEKGKSFFYRELNENKPALVAIPLSAEYKILVQEDVRSFIQVLVARDYRLDTCLYGYNIYRFNKGR